MEFTLHCGSALDVLKTLPDQSVNCIVTSPPYFGLRDYGHPSQIGLEPTPEAFCEALVAVFAESKRVLRDDGVLWANLGDSYCNSDKWGGGGANTGKHTKSVEGDVPSWTAVRRRWAHLDGLKPKDLIGVPWMVAFALRADGWYLRSDVVWQKPNPMPESVTDRPTKSHEYCFLLSKQPRYWYDADAIREKYAPSTLTQFEKPYTGAATKDYAANGVQNPSAIKKRITDKQARHGSRRYDGFNDRWDDDAANLGGANARTVWAIPTEPSPYEHFAVMPKALARKCILAGCPKDGIVLDPFAGVCTTGVVALEEGRSFVGIELNAKYHAMGLQRLREVAPLLAREKTDQPAMQASLI